MMKRRSAALTATVLALLAVACDNRQARASLVINQIRDPGGADPVVYIALSDTPSFTKGYKYYTESYNIATGSSPAIFFSDITWQKSDERAHARSFWLFIARDNDASGGISNFDDVLPAMRIVLNDGEEFQIPLIDFDSSGGGIRLFKADLAAPGKYVKIFIEDPSWISTGSPLLIRFGSSPDLSITFTEIPIRSSLLSTGFFINTAMTHAMAWIDSNGDGNFSAGEWISSLPTSATALVDQTTLILWSGSTF